MKKLLFTLFVLATFFSQELTITIKSSGPQGESESKQYFSENFIIAKSARGLVLFKKGDNNLYTVNDSLTKVAIMDIAQAKAFAEQQAQMMGTMKIKKSKKGKDILGYKTEYYKLSNEGGMGSVKGKLYFAKIDELDTEVYKEYVKINKSMSPTKFDIPDDLYQIEMKMVVEAGPQTITISSEAVKIEKFITDKDFVEKVLALELPKAETKKD